MYTFFRVSIVVDHVTKFDTVALVNNLKSSSSTMFQLYTSFKQHPDRQFSQEDIEIASGNKVLDPGYAKTYLKNLEIASENLHAAFAKQAENAAVRSELLCLGRCP